MFIYFTLIQINSSMNSSNPDPLYTLYSYPNIKFHLYNFNNVFPVYNRSTSTNPNINKYNFQLIYTRK